ncbi:MAG: RluA family pseudouridine synthase [Polyangia bacterium]
MKKLLRAAVGDPGTLVEILAARIQLDPETAAQLVREGRVELAGKKVKLDQPVAVGDRITAFLPDEPLQRDGLVVAYRDRDVIVVDKPAGLRSQGVRGDDWDTLIGKAQRELDPACALLHRLDRDTSGLVILSKSEKARFRLQRSMGQGKIDRRYLARVAGHVAAPLQIALRIGRDANDARRRVGLPADDPNGEEAVTHCTPLSFDGQTTLLRVLLETGRMHQIRVHLATSGHPIVGDTMYGGAASARLLLHADEITFPDVTTGRARTIRSVPPSELGGG